MFTNKTRKISKENKKFKCLFFSAVRKGASRRLTSRQRRERKETGDEARGRRRKKNNNKKERGIDGKNKMISR